MHHHQYATQTIAKYHTHIDTVVIQLSYTVDYEVTSGIYWT